MKMFQKFTTVLALCLSLNCSATTSSPRDFQVFWSQFRAASLSYDYPTLEKLIHFPLKVRGITDDIPVQQYKKIQLPNIFPKLMSQTVIQAKDKEYVAMAFSDVIQRLERVDAKSDETNVRVEELEFEVIEGRWYLVRAYLNEE